MRVRLASPFLVDSTGNRLDAKNLSSLLRGFEENFGRKISEATMLAFLVICRVMVVNGDVLAFGGSLGAEINLIGSGQVGVDSYHCFLDVDGDGSPDSLEFWTNPGAFL
jgi:hypothetical protein